MKKKQVNSHHISSILNNIILTALVRFTNQHEVFRLNYFVLHNFLSRIKNVECLKPFSNPDILESSGARNICKFLRTGSIEHNYLILPTSVPPRRTLPKRELSPWESSRNLGPRQCPGSFVGRAFCLGRIDIPRCGTLDAETLLFLWCFKLVAIMGPSIKSVCW